MGGGANPQESETIRSPHRFPKAIVKASAFAPVPIVEDASNGATSWIDGLTVFRESYIAAVAHDELEGRFLQDRIDTPDILAFAACMRSLGIIDRRRPPGAVVLRPLEDKNLR